MTLRIPARWPKPARRRGFTLVELLVVIAIIATLVGLLIPAVNAARESSRRTQCTNNLYQQAIGGSRHDEAIGCLPGWRNAAGKNFVSWPVVLFPYTDQNSTYTAIVSNQLSSPPAIAGLKCPSSPPADADQPVLAYAGNCGSGGSANPFRYDGVMIDLIFAGSNANLRIDLDDVGNGDGTSQTLLLAEKSGAVGATSALTAWNLPVVIGPLVTTGSFAFAPGCPVPAIGIVAARQAGGSGAIVNPTSEGAPGLASQPSSRHPGGAVAAFCDGHTDFLRDTLDPQVYAQILSWNHLRASPISRSTWGADSRFPLSSSDLD